jgi:hypothetical protein
MISPLKVCGACAKMLSEATRQPAQMATFFIDSVSSCPMFGAA